jgi:hypothetical protein
MRWPFLKHPKRPPGTVRGFDAVRRLKRGTTRMRIHVETGPRTRARHTLEKAIVQENCRSIAQA